MIASTACRVAGGLPGSSRTRRTLPGVVAIATWPRITRLIRGSDSSPATSASICSAIGHIGSTRPLTPRIRPSSSSAATGSASTSLSPASIRLPIGWPASAPLPPNRCWMMVAHSRPCGLSDANAANAIRRSPGGTTSSSLRSRPDEPPSSATVTTAVTCGVSRRAADSVAYSPCPPPRATMRELIRGPDPGAAPAPSVASPPCRRAASASAIATLRCLPPVQPMATVM